MFLKLAKGDEYESELNKLTEIFKDVDDGRKKLIEGLVQDAAFLYAENIHLRMVIENTGMVRIHPKIEGLQKPTEVAKQYLKNVNSYAVVIKTLSSVLGKNAPEEDDAFDNWLASKRSVSEE